MHIQVAQNLVFNCFATKNFLLLNNVTTPLQSRCTKLSKRYPLLLLTQNTVHNIAKLLCLATLYCYFTVRLRFLEKTIHCIAQCYCIGITLSYVKYISYHLVRICKFANNACYKNYTNINLSPSFKNGNLFRISVRSSFSKV